MTAAPGRDDSGQPPHDTCCEERGADRSQPIGACFGAARDDDERDADEHKPARLDESLPSSNVHS